METPVEEKKPFVDRDYTSLSFAPVFDTSQPTRKATYRSFVVRLPPPPGTWRDPVERKLQSSPLGEILFKLFPALLTTFSAAKKLTSQYDSSLDEVMDKEQMQIQFDPPHARIFPEENTNEWTYCAFESKAVLFHEDRGSVQGPLTSSEDATPAGESTVPSSVEVNRVSKNKPRAVIDSTLTVKPLPTKLSSSTPQTMFTSRASKWGASLDVRARSWPFQHPDELDVDDGRAWTVNDIDMMPGGLRGFYSKYPGGYDAFQESVQATGKGFFTGPEFKKLIGPALRCSRPVLPQEQSQRPVKDLKVGMVVVDDTAPVIPQYDGPSSIDGDSITLQSSEHVVPQYRRLQTVTNAVSEIRQRPATSVAVAQRMITHDLGLKLPALKSTDCQVEDSVASVSRKLPVADVKNKVEQLARTLSSRRRADGAKNFGDDEAFYDDARAEQNVKRISAASNHNGDRWTKSKEKEHSDTHSDKSGKSSRASPPAESTQEKQDRIAAAKHERHIRTQINKICDEEWTRMLLESTNIREEKARHAKAQVAARRASSEAKAKTSEATKDEVEMAASIETSSTPHIIDKETGADVDGVTETPEFQVEVPTLVIDASPTPQAYNERAGVAIDDVRDVQVEVPKMSVEASPLAEVAEEETKVAAQKPADVRVKSPAQQLDQFQAAWQAKLFGPITAAQSKQRPSSSPPVSRSTSRSISPNSSRPLKVQAVILKEPEQPEKNTYIAISVEKTEIVVAIEKEEVIVAVEQIAVQASTLISPNTCVSSKDVEDQITSTSTGESVEESIPAIECVEFHEPDRVDRSVEPVSFVALVEKENTKESVEVAQEENIVDIVASIEEEAEDEQPEIAQELGAIIPDSEEIKSTDVRLVAAAKHFIGMLTSGINDGLDYIIKHAVVKLLKKRLLISISKGILVLSPATSRLILEQEKLIDLIINKADELDIAIGHAIVDCVMDFVEKENEENVVAPETVLAPVEVNNAFEQQALKLWDGHTYCDIDPNFSDDESEDERGLEIVSVSLSYRGRC